MKFIIAAFLILYHLSAYSSDAKGLTMITRGCIANYLRKNQLLDVSFKIGPIPKASVCNNVLKKTVESVIDSSINGQIKISEESTDDVIAYKECFNGLIDRNNMTDLLLKNFMYHEEELPKRNETELITNEILNLFDFLCHPNALQKDFERKFTTTFSGYEKETNRYCLVTLLRDNLVIDQDFNVNFELTETTNVKCPDYINAEILNVKTEAFDLIYQSNFYGNETIWECAAEERMKIGYVRAYYRLMAYTFSKEDDTKKAEERQKFLDVLLAANELASNCFKIGYEDL